MKRHSSAGFSLVEMMVVVIVGGILVAAAVPMFRGFRQTDDLHNAARDIAGQISLAREKAMATGAMQTIRFMENFGGASDYHIWANDIAAPAWSLPRGITYLWGSGTQNTFRMTTDGRCLDTGMIIVQNERGLRDTVSVRLSGLVIHF